jgi:hypothetical protein
MKLQAPTSSIQRNFKRQAPISERGGLQANDFAVWNLEFLWSWEVGISRF